MPMQMVRVAPAVPLRAGVARLRSEELEGSRLVAQVVQVVRVVRVEVAALAEGRGAVPRVR